MLKKIEQMVEDQMLTQKGFDLNDDSEEEPGVEEEPKVDFKNLFDELVEEVEQLEAEPEKKVCIPAPKAPKKVDLSKMSARERRFYKLKQQQKKKKVANKKDTRDAHRILNVPTGKGDERKNYIERKKEKEKELKEGLRDRENPHLYESAMYAKQRDSKKRKRKDGAFGWDVFNQDTLYRAYEKRLKKIKHTGEVKNPTELVDGQKLAIDHKPSEDAKQDMINELKQTIERRGKFKRRRRFYENENVTWINKRNEVFNRKVGRAFDKYAQEIRANLERGTAL